MARKKSAEKKPIDREIYAVKQIMAAVNELSRAGIQRVLNYVQSHIDSEYPARPEKSYGTAVVYGGVPSPLAQLGQPAATVFSGSTTQVGTTRNDRGDE